MYVVSLLVQDKDDDPRQPTLTVGHNTERRVVECTPSRGQKPKWAIASDASEARWNYAFWLQNALAVVCDSALDQEGAKLVERWARDRGCRYTDEDAKREFNATLQQGERLTQEFVELVVALVADLHRAGELARQLPRQVPVLIHELEYYDAVADQNARANPPELVVTSWPGALAGSVARCIGQVWTGGSPIWGRAGPPRVTRPCWQRCPSEAIGPFRDIEGYAGPHRDSPSIPAASTNFS